MLLRFTAIRAQYHPELGLLRFQWNSGRAETAKFRQSMNSVAQLMEQGTVTCTLQDLTGLPSLSLDDQLWLATSWLPRVSLPAVKQVALVLPERDVYNHMVVESLIRLAHPLLRHYDIQFFSTVSGALDWLVGDAQDQLAAEWTQHLP